MVSVKVCLTSVDVLSFWYYGNSLLYPLIKILGPYVFLKIVFLDLVLHFFTFVN